MPHLNKKKKPKPKGKKKNHAGVTNQVYTHINKTENIFVVVVPLLNMLSLAFTLLISCILFSITGVDATPFTCTPSDNCAGVMMDIIGLTAGLMTFIGLASCCYKCYDWSNTGEEEHRTASPVLSTTDPSQPPEQVTMPPTVPPKDVTINIDTTVQVPKLEESVSGISETKQVEDAIMQIPDMTEKKKPNEQQKKEPIKFFHLEKE